MRPRAGGGTVAIAVVDLFRIGGGQIVEHWDATESVPETTASGNPLVWPSPASVGRSQPGALHLAIS